MHLFYLSAILLGVCAFSAYADTNRNQVGSTYIKTRSFPVQHPRDFSSVDRRGPKAKKPKFVACPKSRFVASSSGSGSSTKKGAKGLGKRVKVAQDAFGVTTDNDETLTSTDMNACSVVFVWTKTRLYGAHVSIGDLDGLVQKMDTDKENIEYVTVVVRSDGDDEYDELKEIIEEELTDKVSIEKGKYDARLAEDDDPEEIQNANYWITATFAAKGKYRVQKKA